MTQSERFQPGRVNVAIMETHIQNWTRDFVKLIVENHCMPNPSYGVLRKPCCRSTSVFCSVESGVAALDFGMSDVVCYRCTVNGWLKKRQILKWRDIKARIMSQMTC